MKYLIVGADGFIGSYLYRRLKAEGELVLGTSRRTDAPKEFIAFDIERDDGEILLREELVGGMAVVCIAQSRIDKCREEYERSYNINVTRTLMLMQELSRSGLQVLAFSSDQVFDGITGGYEEDCATNPLNGYGRMKADLERAARKEIPSACIFRISKTVDVIAAPQNVLTEWALRCRQGREIPCIQGNRITFVYVDDVYRAVRVAAERHLHGIYNITGDTNCNRADLARQFIGMAGYGNIDVNEYPVSHFRFRENRPLDVTLKNDKFKQQTGFQFTDMETVMKTYIVNNLARWGRNFMNPFTMKS